METKTAVKKRVRKPAVKKVAPIEGAQGAGAPEAVVKKLIPYATVIEVKHRILGIFSHTHHMVSVIRIEKEKADMLREGATEATALASRVMGVKTRVVCVVPVQEGELGITIADLRKKHGV